LRGEEGVAASGERGRGLIDPREVVLDGIPQRCENTFDVKESEATDHFITTFDAVSAVRLLGWAWKLDTAGEEWLREHVSRQQLAFIQRQFEEAGVPWAPGAIQWPAVMRGAKRALENARALDARTQAAARAARRRRRTA
jgi:hypothetical protein